MRIFLCGDVMTGRGIDQALPHPCSPVLHEGYVNSAIDCLRLAEQANGPVPRPADFAYVWGARLDEWLSARPHARIVNLETSITRSDAFEPKGINYRMSPENAPCLNRRRPGLLRSGQQPCSRLGPGRSHRHFGRFGEAAHQDRRRGPQSRRGQGALNFRDPSSLSDWGFGVDDFGELRRLAAWDRLQARLRGGIWVASRTLA